MRKHSLKKKILTRISAFALLGIVGGAYLAVFAESEPEVIGGQPTARLISNDQYKHAIHAIFGSDIQLAVSFPPVQRLEGLVGLGTAQAQVTASAAELYYQSARSIAAQVTDQSRREFLMRCEDADLSDEACLKNVIGKYGRLLFRRSLSETELTKYVEYAKSAASVDGDPYAGVSNALTGLLVSPQFLFFMEEIESDSSSRSKVRLTGSSIATRMSLLLWDAPPDDELLRAGEKGELHSRKGLQKQVERLISSPKLEDGVRAFFTDLMVFENFDKLSKDPVIYPAFTDKVAADAKEQTLRTLVYHLIVRNGDYRDIFVTPDTFLTGDLGMIYQIPVDLPNDWNPYRFTEQSGRGGILTHLSFLALYSHPGRSSPTIRGKGLREIFMCQAVPNAPPNVDFSGFEDPNSRAKTARERLEAHRTNPTCAGCHKITDPIGLALENFDGAGHFRTTENGVTIDTSGELGSDVFTNAIGLGKAMRNEPATTNCLVNRLFDYGRGYKSKSADSAWLRTLNQKFADDGYSIPSLLRAIATSKAFYAVTMPDKAVKTASAK